MGLLILTLLLLPLAQGTATTRPPAPQEPADLVVLKFSWNDYLNRPDRDRDLYQTPIQAGDAEVNKREEHRPAYKRTFPSVQREPQPGRHRVARNVQGFQYKASFRNAGSKAVRSVEWEYVFIDPTDGKEVARHAFESRQTIKPGRSREFIHFSVSPPTKVVSAGALGTGESRRPFTERVIIKKIVYTDRTSWQRP